MGWLDDAGADRGAHADQDQATEELPALPGAHPDSRAQLQPRQRHHDTDRPDDRGGKREADMVGAEREPDREIVDAQRDPGDQQPAKVLPAFSRARCCGAGPQRLD